jgi:glyoxylase-like metal-dependent hydrolase (beta-lactamase superfamily II)
VSSGTVSPLRAAGVHRLVLPTPYAVGDANAYLIDDDPLTLIDTGPNEPVSLAALEAELASIGQTVEAIELIVVTHEHLDHLGLARTIAARSGARIAGLDRLAPYTADVERAWAADRELGNELMLRHGVDREAIERQRASSERDMNVSFELDRPLEDGAALELRDRRLRVLHAPGHSATDTLFHDEERGILFVGDHLLAAISSNALVSSRLYAAPGVPLTPVRRRALVEYVAALRATRDLELDVVLSGHGAPIVDHRALIDDRLERIDTRAERIAALLAERPRTVHEVALELWGKLAVAQPSLTTSEVLGHTDLLVDAGRAVEVEDGGRTLLDSA